MAENKNVLFICMGNICRSPMAEYFFRSRLGPNPSWSADSAGLAAVDGLPASQTAIEVMSELGIDIKMHRSRELTPELIDAATIILVMTNDQALEVKRRFPKARDRVHLLGSFNRDLNDHPAAFSSFRGLRASLKLQPEGRPAGAGKNIFDPVGSSAEVYRRTRDDIVKNIDGLIHYLRSFQENKQL